MKRAWIGLALLSGSWLFGLSYYLDANWVAWAVLVAVGVALLTGVAIPKPSRAELLITAALMIPAIWLLPWPYRAGALLLFAGAALWAMPIPRPWPARLAGASLAAGAILVAQSLGIVAYESLTARSHELPGPLAWLVYGVTRLLGIDAALDGTTVAVPSMRRVHPLGATWELLLDPVTWSFLLGGIVLALLNSGCHVHARVDMPGSSEDTCLRERRHGTRVWGRLIVLLFAVALWLPIRAGLLIAVFVHRALRTEYESPLLLMNQFWNPWVHLVLLAGPVLLAMRFVRAPSMPPAEAAEPRGGFVGRLAWPVAACLAAVAVTFGILWDPAGIRKPGRILVDEYHSTWEPTGRPYDPNWYGQESGYNYACIYDYCSRFYEMGRLTTPIDANALAACDVLMVKVPTSRYSSEEIDRIERFVQAGGGLLLVGEHTNVFNVGVHLNDIASRFGFRFRHDCLFDIDGVFRELYRPPPASHPIVQHIGPLDFAVSCSIDPGAGLGRAAIRNVGLRNLPADYHASNFYPQVEDRAEARYGSFVQLWTTRRGAGRVAAFTDSTIFSNFSTFEPGKAELMLGMLDWLNHRNVSHDVRPLLLGLGVLLGAVAVVLNLRTGGSRFAVIGAVLLGWSVAVAGVQAVHESAYPAPKPVRPFTHVVIDRTVCDAPLSTSGFIAGEPNGFGIFERWILRLGYFTSRRQGADAFVGDALVFMHPNKPVSREFRTALSDYVVAGGTALILDSPANTKSTANTLLYPFGLSVDHNTLLKGTLAPPEGWPAVTVDSACEVKGGTPLIRLGNTVVAAGVEHGKGRVVVVGFASRFSDRQMGVTGDVVPDAQLRQVYDLEFSLLRTILQKEQ